MSEEFVISDVGSNCYDKVWIYCVWWWIWFKFVFFVIFVWFGNVRCERIVGDYEFVGLVCVGEKVLFIMI